jgi:hypothetical protein
MEPNELLLDLELGLALFGDLVQQAPDLRRRLVEQQAIFGPPAPDGDREERVQHAARALEWFLFEGPGDGAPLPAEELLERWREAAGERLRVAPELYLQSVTGVYAVESVESDGTLGVRELAGLTPLRLVPAQRLGDLRPGDLLVGRIFHLGSGLHAGTPALAPLRNAEVRRALERDLARLREGRTHAVLRLSQLELERMFWSPSKGDGAVLPTRSGDGAPVGDAEASGDPVGELERFLTEGGLDAATISDWKRVLSRAPFDPRRLVTGVDDVVGAMLEELAFRTRVDLESARARLLQAWPRLAATGIQAPEEARAPRDAEPGSVAASLEEFDRDRAAGLGVEASFDALERRLGLADDDEDADSGAPDFPGVVGAMVEEFLWESELVGGPEARRDLEGLRLFADALSTVGVFENVGPRDVLGFLTFRVPEGGAVRTDEEARALVGAMEDFARWSSSAQGVELVDDELAPALEALRESLPRVVRANRTLREGAAPEDELFEYLGPGASGLARVRDAGELEREVDADPGVCAELLPGDLFRGHTLESGRFRIGRCYPPQARLLREAGA